MPCTITDIYGYRVAAGTLTGKAGQIILAVPSSTAATYKYTATYRTSTAINPNISGSPAVTRGVTVTTDATGSYTLALPYLATETHPTTNVKWSILFPDGMVASGEVPSVAGPLTIDDLILTYGWTWSTQIATAPVVAGVLARGIATFSGGTDTASIVFGSPFVSAGYAIKLTISYDSGTLALPMYANKTTTGFDIKVTDSAFVGTVDWEAAL